jgi:renal tumor antigen
MDFDFPDKEGTGINKLIPQLSEDSKDIIGKLLIYNPDNRITANQALKHPFFKELRDQDK